MPLVRFLRSSLPFVALLVATHASADMVRLRNGTEIHGTIVTKSDSKDAPVTVKKLSGEEVSFIPSEVRYTLKRPLIQEEYLEKLETLPDTLEGHWQMAEWCRTKGLKQEREAHLQRVLDFDPQHAAAHRAFEHVRDGNEWVTLDELKTRQGYIKYQGKYMLPQDLEVAERAQQLKGAHKDWHRKILQYQRALKGDRPEEARGNLLAIRDPDAVPGLLLCFQNSPDEKQRQLLVTVLTKIPSQEAVSALVLQSLLDSSAELRDFAFTLIPSEEKKDAIAWYTRALKHPFNIVVNRAARSLYLLDGRDALPALIDSVTTTHRVVETKVIATPVSAADVGNTNKPLIWDNNGAIPVGYGYYGQGFSQFGITRNTGGPALDGGAYTFIGYDGFPRFVQIKQLDNVQVTSRKSFHNPDVLMVLKEFTSQDFGYDKNAWRQWWRSQHPQSIISKP